MGMRRSTRNGFGSRRLLLSAAVGVAVAGPALAANETLPADVASGWVFAKSLRDGFKAHGYEVVSKADGHPVRAGTQSLRFEVRAGDCGRDPRRFGWDDCARDRERHELIQRGDRQKEGREFWYGWSIFAPEDWPNVFPAKVAIGQFHQRGDHVVWMFQNAGGGLHVDNQVPGRTIALLPLIAAKDFRGRWHDIAVHARWSREADGFFRVFVNGAPAYEHAGATMTAEEVYFKFGIYRSFVSRWRAATGKRDLPTQVLYLDEIRRGPTRDSVTPGPR